MFLPVYFLFVLCWLKNVIRS